MPDSDWKTYAVAPAQTHHLRNGMPAYERRFQQVLKFHPPGLAAVLDGDGAYHITPLGEPAYKARFSGTFGFYEGKAAVFDGAGWHHIRPDGGMLYAERYQWCGNYQEGRVPVRSNDGRYRYLDEDGIPIGDAWYRYAGDYRDGIACVREASGQCRHIDRHGHQAHDSCYLDLDVFHKGLARARDAQGWFHIHRDGRPAYCHRFSEVEPFYNGQAHCLSWTGERIIIDERGQVVHRIGNPIQLVSAKQAACVVIVGNVGVGKTTLGKLLAKHFNAVLLSIDDFRRRLSDGSPAGEIRAWQQFLEALINPQPLIVEFSGSGYMAPMVKLALAGRAYSVLWIKAAPDLCLSRIRSRETDVPYPAFGVSLEQLAPELHRRLEEEMTAAKIWPHAQVQSIDGSAAPAQIADEAVKLLGMTV